MKKFLIYGCLSGSFGGLKGGTTSFEIVDCKDEDEARMCAYRVAREVFEGYEGNYGIKSEEECENEEDYNEEIESWIDYDVIKEVDDNFDIDEYTDSLLN